MQLNELDKSKLPVKVVSGVSGNVYNIKYIGKQHILAEDEDGKEYFLTFESDRWSPYQEPKIKVALYAFKPKHARRWFLTENFYANDEDYLNSILFDPSIEFKRLMWSEMEV